MAPSNNNCVFSPAAALTPCPSPDAGEGSNYCTAGMTSVNMRASLVALVIFGWVASLQAHPPEEENSPLASIERRIRAVHEAVRPAVVRIDRSKEPNYAVGSGVIVTADGHVVAGGRHGMPRGEAVAFHFADGRRATGIVLGCSRQWGLSAMKITDPGPWPHVEFGKSAGMKNGDLCIGLGYPWEPPHEQEPRLCFGCIANPAAPTSFRTTWEGGDYGGGVFDFSGRLVGVTTYSEHTSIETVERHWDDLIAGKQIDPVLAVEAQGPPDARADADATQRQPASQERVAAAIASAKSATVKISQKVNILRSCSGVVVTADGYIITCAHHQWLPGQDVLVSFAGGPTVTGKILGSNPVSDVGMAKIAEKGPWPHAELGDSTAMKPGDSCLLLGYPLAGKKETVIISSFAEMLLGVPPHQRPDGRIVVRQSRVVAPPVLPVVLRHVVNPGVLYTSGPLSGGDSGGGVFDLDGRVVGIHTGGGIPGKSFGHARVELLKSQWNVLAEAKPVDGLSSPGLAEIREPFSKIARPASPVLVRVQQRRGDWRGRTLGTIIGREGWILAAQMLNKSLGLDLADSISCRFADGRNLPATVHKVLPEYNLVVLKVNADNLPEPDWSDRKDMPAGTLIAALQPGAAPSVGVVSHAGRRSASHGVFEANILLEGEMCGGPVVDRTGRIVGISTHTTESGHVPIFSVTAARKVANQLTGAVSD